MKFVIVISASMYQHQASDSAYHFTKAALEKGHEIVKIFFYHDGVYNASYFSHPPQDERSLYKQWVALAKTYQLSLIVCVAAAYRRGILNAAEAKRCEKAHYNVQPPFEISGLGQLMQASIEADRVIVFGA